VPDAHYENPRLAEIYDVDSAWSIDRDYYLALAGSSPQKILDLGCGTGLLCEAYAVKGHEVTGVDPSPAMLDIARQRPYGQDIEWVQAFAQSYQSENRFDLIIMTGHTFQVLLGDDDIQATIATMSKHLNPGGRVAFESRNYAIDWAPRWNKDTVLKLPCGDLPVSRCVHWQKDGQIFFEARFAFPDEVLVSQSKLRFLSREEIETHLAAFGLYAEKIFGDWNGNPFDENSSDEIIFIARAAS